MIVTVESAIALAGIAAALIGTIDAEVSALASFISGCAFLLVSGAAGCCAGLAGAFGASPAGAAFARTTGAAIVVACGVGWDAPAVVIGCGAESRAIGKSIGSAFPSDASGDWDSAGCRGSARAPTTSTATAAMASAYAPGVHDFGDGCRLASRAPPTAAGADLAADAFAAVTLPLPASVVTDGSFETRLSPRAAAFRAGFDRDRLAVDDLLFFDE